MSAAVYILLDPRDQSTRYVGWTVKTLKQRLCSHMKDLRGSCWRVHWIQKLKRLGVAPIPRELQPTSEITGPFNEQCWIKILRSMGRRLVNATDGGEGAPGHRHTEEHLAKMRAAWTPERKAKASVRMAARVVSDRSREVAAARLKARPLALGKPKTTEHRQRIAEVQRGRRAGAVTKQRMSAAQRGKSLSVEHRRKIAQARLRGALNPARVRELMVLGMTTVEIASRLGVSATTVRRKAASP